MAARLPDTPEPIMAILDIDKIPYFLDSDSEGISPRLIRVP